MRTKPMRRGAAATIITRNLAASPFAQMSAAQVKFECMAFEHFIPRRTRTSLAVRSAFNHAG